ncbi:MAG TPA: hypothetical protein VLE73_06000 [Candidatus Saccharimonadales bacterium]|nr:hypothetical protein [Candidatus Saccharimonadales bacterium]
MRIFKTLGLSLGAVLLLVAVPSSFVSADRSNEQLEGVDAKALTELTSAAALTDCRRQSAANSAGQDIFLSTASPKTYLNASGAWQGVDCASTTFRLAFNQRAVVVLDFNAESDCNGTTPTNGQWCQTRALLNGAEGAPVAAEPSSFAFDGVAGGVSNWQANSMQRAWEIRCGVSTGCQYKVAVQTRMHDATVTSMWLDEIAAHLRVTYGNPAAL